MGIFKVINYNCGAIKKKVCWSVESNFSFMWGYLSFKKQLKLKQNNFEQTLINL